MKKPVPDIRDSHICDGDRGFCHFAPTIFVPDIASKRGDTPDQHNVTHCANAIGKFWQKG